MATLNISITVPDQHVSEMVDAINWHAPRVDENGAPDPRNAAECQAWIKASMVSALKDIFTRYRVYQRDQQAISPDPDIT